MNTLSLAVIASALSLTATSSNAGEAVAVSQTRVIAVATDIAEPCLAYPMRHETTVSVPESTLEKLASGYKPRWKTEEERLALIAGRRAELLLKAKTDVTTSNGCKVIDPEQARGKHFGDSGEYLIAELIESGMASISRPGIPELAREVQITDTSAVCQRGGIGSKAFNIEGHPIFLVLMTCLSHPEPASH